MCARLHTEICLLHILGWGPPKVATKQSLNQDPISEANVDCFAPCQKTTRRPRAAKPAMAPVSALLHEIKLNRLLAALPSIELIKWLPELELMEMPLGHVLYEAGATETSV